MGLAVGAGAGAAAENGLFGATALIAGNALLAAGLAADAGGAANGFLAAAPHNGGNPAAAGILGGADGA